MTLTRRIKALPSPRSCSPPLVKQEEDDFDNILSSRPDPTPPKKKRKKSKVPLEIVPSALPTPTPRAIEPRNSASAPISPKRSTKRLTPPPIQNIESPPLALAPSISTFLSSLPLALHDQLYPSFSKLGCVTPTDLLVMASQTVLGTNCRAQFLVALKQDLLEREVELSAWQEIVLKEGFKGIWEKYGK